LWLRLPFSAYVTGTRRNVTEVLLVAFDVRSDYQQSEKKGRQEKKRHKGKAER
jgi:hypothetical protein